MAWEGIIGAVDAARVNKQQIVDFEHLMKALLEQRDGLARRIFTKAGLDNMPVLQATDNFIAQQPKACYYVYWQPTSVDTLENTYLMFYFAG